MIVAIKKPENSVCSKVSNLLNDLVILSLCTKTILSEVCLIWVMTGNDSNSNFSIIRKRNLPPNGTSLK